MSKEAISIILDVGPAMNQAPPGENSAFDTAVNCITMILQRKMFAESKDEVALILLGTPESNNDLADGESYENISIVRPMGLVDFDLMKYVQQEVQPSNVSADFLDAMVVGVDHIMKSIEGKRGFGGKRIILFSNLGGEFADSALDDITASLREFKVELNVIGPDLDEDDSDMPDHHGNHAANANGDVKEKSSQQRAGEAMMRHILEQVDGTSYSFSEALPALSFFQTRQVKGVAWKCTLDIGSQLKVPLAGYIRVKEAKSKGYKTVYAKDSDAGIETLRTYHLNDEEETEIEKEDTVVGHRYGNTLVPFSEDDLENMKYSADKCLKVLGFTKAENVKRHQYMGDNVMSFIAEKGDEAAAVAFSALVQAMYETNTVIIVRKVYRNNSSPRLGFLSPHIKANYQCMFYTDLPFSEDVRQFTFGSLPLKSDNAVVNKKLIPTDEQLSAVDDLITEMDLSHATFDDDNEPVEAMKPKLTFNPHLQRLYQCLQHRAQNPDEPLPELSPLVAGYLKPPQEVQTKCSEAADNLRKLFKLEMSAKQKEQQTGEKVFKSGQDEDAGPSTKKAKLDDDLAGGMAGLAKTNVTEVGTVTPVEDFYTIIRQKDEDRFEEGCKMMKKRIQQIIKDSFGSQFYSKAMDCLKALRTKCVENGEPAFNDYLKELREYLSTENRTNFWDLVVKENITLISSAESSESDVSPAEAAKFLKQVQSEKMEEEQPQDDDDADDLLEELE